MDLICYAFALVCFLIDAFLTIPRVKLTPLGLAFLTITLIL